MTATHLPPQRWDIFCRVIDNFGDIGVCWRLARQLAAEYGFNLRLWVDAPEAFLRICPEAQFVDDSAVYQNVTICRWPQHWPMTTPEQTADVVIEGFGCDLPGPYITAMAQLSRPPLWLNLEYLSAETWVEGCHGLTSPQANGLTKYFFFPGFSPRTGGLLLEKDLLLRRQEFQASVQARLEFLTTLGIQPQPDEILISLFCYSQPKLDAWLDSLAKGQQRCLMLVPEGIAMKQVAGFLEREQLCPGEECVRGSLRIRAIPFLSQENYDPLLWSCDVNLVRGEDSFVRAQWAGRPFLWHIYPQDDETHLVKLASFLTRYTAELPPRDAELLNQLWLAWNRGEPPPNSEWLLSACNRLHRAHAKQWSGTLSQEKSLAETLVRFYQNWL